MLNNPLMSAGCRGLALAILGFMTLNASAPLAGEPDVSLLPLQTINNINLPPGYLARVNLNQPSEVLAILERAEDYFEKNGLEADVPPVVLVIHGPEVAMFDRRNYSEYTRAVDLAAKLSALNVIDVKICETRMSMEGLDRSNLLPFVSTVPFGPEEERRLRDDESYVYF